ncbi:HlyD family efflux transporter periplasmic adaptor subunit [Propionicimonas sp.]|uniref:HlyD family secretion protein n=1 Tax=Propionicimonas sp. TaxID=1955623 RepID=UPI0017B3B729|nr:HlyD family efflux transporter periplasmic adaptor subunit [Propionicimonas sp.]MBU3976584.1 HlyD family efflux transporter periplasmic adaptor subunit [Actinomycetota bacterium]MBA3020416.1 HlyD family efflux transporter periplasmic adaptor subunit [Propionicimonas sp.]MBU3986589.1 HlyD family efflux transporter periplasmic adaptor subunit [Actinomycetota bacterium]MBU4007259.1 HlyD family efflux transporter periplasmic adaptor subunit [Actinomycetota bacterium]MBU4065012.1 HlyD family eff
MTWINRLRLALGVLGVIVLTFGLALVFNHRQNQVASYQAEVAADTFNVGADHSGTVIKQAVEAGDTVTKGQLLFEVQSLQLKEDLANGLEVQDTPVYKVDAKRGVIAYFAVADGRVEALNAQKGNSVPGGGSLATIYGGDRFILADFHLTPRDYARVVPGAPARVTLANDQVISANVEHVAVASSADGAVATLRLDSKELLSLGKSTLAEPGAPLIVTVELADSGPLAPITDAVNDLLQQVGLR